MVMSFSSAFTRIRFIQLCTNIVFNICLTIEIYFGFLRLMFTPKTNLTTNLSQIIGLCPFFLFKPFIQLFCVKTLVLS